ncbi:MAG: hypothetical protein HY644_15540 [Acidobacteria bacterium]|nr:hypothetical protein [Acidobacteriota bacterium]
MKRIIGSFVTTTRTHIAKKKLPLAPRLLPLAVATVLIFLIFSALRSHHNLAEALARQHNLQHLRLIELVAATLENRLTNMQTAFKQYAALIAPPFEADSSAEKICGEIEQSFSTAVSSALIVKSDKTEDLWTRKLSALALTSASLARLERAIARSNPNLLLLLSLHGKSSLLFLTPIQSASAYLGVVVPIEHLIATYHLNDPHYDKDYL